MPNDNNESKPRSVRTRPANVIRAIVLGAAAAAAPPGCDESVEVYGVPPVDGTTEDAAGDVSGDESSEDVAATDEGGTMDVVPPYGVPDGVEYGVPDGVGPDAVPPYGVPDGVDYGVPDGVEPDAGDAAPDATDPDATVDYGVPDSGTEVVPPYGAPEYGVPDYGTPDYGVPVDAGTKK